MTPTHPNTAKRLKSGVPGLDDMLRGGFPEQSAVLLLGSPGTGKTTMGLQFIYHGAKFENEPGLIVTFEEFPEQMYRDAMNLGMDLKALEKDGKLRTIFTSPEVFKQELEKPMGMVSETVKELGVKRLFIDSVTHFQRQAPDHYAGGGDLFKGLVNGLKREHLTAILTCESGDLLGESAQVDNRIPYIVDTVVVMKYVEIDSEIQKALFVLKARGTDHDKDIRRYEVKQGGVQVENKFEDREGLLGGLTRKSFKTGFLQAFKKG